MLPATMPLLLTLLLAPVTGCSEKANKFGSDDDPLTSGPSDIAHAVCPRAYECCMAAELMGNDLAGTDVASCEQKTTDSFRAHFDSIRRSRDQGRVVFEDAKLIACLAHIRGATCEALNTTNHLTGVEGCESFVQPLVMPGAACSFDWECQRGRCVEAASGDATSAGSGRVCRADARAGESCAATLPCEAGLICDGATTTCVALLANGAACGNGLQCKSGRCAPAASGAGAGTCEPRPADSCFYATACAYGGARQGALSGLILVTSLVFLGASRRRRRA
jgi:hypothetical protein